MMAWSVSGLLEKEAKYQMVPDYSQAVTLISVPLLPSNYISFTSPNSRKLMRLPA
jgi:hypothetical protein